MDDTGLTPEDEVRGLSRTFGVSEEHVWRQFRSASADVGTYATHERWARAQRLRAYALDRHKMIPAWSTGVRSRHDRPDGS